MHKHNISILTISLIFVIENKFPYRLETSSAVAALPYGVVTTTDYGFIDSPVGTQSNRVGARSSSKADLLALHSPGIYNLTTSSSLNVYL